MATNYYKPPRPRRDLALLSNRAAAYFKDSTPDSAQLAEWFDGAADLDDRMAKEMGDVKGAIQFVAKRFGLDEAAINLRAVEKFALFETWHADESNGAECFHSPATQS